MKVKLSSLAACLCLSLCATPPAHAQSVNWLSQINSGQMDWASSVARDPSGSVYITGYAENWPDGGANVSLAKFSSTGSLAWIQQLETTSYEMPYGLTTDALGNVYVAGVTDGNLQGDNQGGEDAFILKYNSAGDLMWTRQFGATGCCTNARDVVSDGQGNIYVVGMTEGSLGNGENQGDYDLFVSRFNADGQPIWTTMLGSDDYEELWGAAADGQGGLYIAGYTYGSIAADNKGNGDAYVARINSDGTLNWESQFGTSQDDVARAIDADALGNVFVTGATTGVLGGSNQGHNDAFLTKFDADGNLIETLQFGTTGRDGAWDVAADSQGGAYIAGYTEGSLGATNQGSDDAFVAKYDADGTLAWITQLGSDTYDTATGVAYDGHGGVYACGWTEGSLGGPIEGLSDAFLMKIHDATAVPEPGVFTLALLLALVGLHRRR